MGKSLENINNRVQSVNYKASLLEDKDKVDQLEPLLRQNEDQMGEDKETKK